MNEKVIISVGDVEYWEKDGKIKEVKIQPFAHRSDVPSNYSFTFVKGKVIDEMVYRGASYNRLKRLKALNNIDDLGNYLEKECGFYGKFEYKDTRSVMNEFTIRYNRDSLEIERLEGYKDQYPEGSKHRPLLDKRIDERKRHRAEMEDTINLLREYLGK